MDIKLTILHAANGHTRTVKVAGREVSIIIPPAVKKLHNLVYGGCGGLGKNGAPNGDLYVRITVMDTHRWTLIGRDIHSTEPVDLFVALLGGTLTVETLQGLVKVRIPPRTANGTRIWLEGKGYPRYESSGPPGDFWVIIHVSIPLTLDAVEIKLLKEIRSHRKSRTKAQK